jgi:DNA-binding MarR family transcriptional regulator
MTGEPELGRPKFDSPLQELYLNMWRSYDRLRELEDELFDRFGLSSQQYNVLRLLKAALPQSVATLSLADRLVSRSPDITRLLDRLVERGLIERTRSDEDRRQVLARITSAGVRLLKSIAEPLEECHQRQLGHLSSAEVKSLIELLKSALRPHEQPDSAWGGKQII